MSTLNSPTASKNSSRSKKLEGGRIRFAVYLPQEEADYIEQLANQLQLS